MLRGYWGSSRESSDAWSTLIMSICKLQATSCELQVTSHELQAPSQQAARYTFYGATRLTSYQLPVSRWTRYELGLLERGLWACASFATCAVRCAWALCGCACAPCAPPAG